METVCTGPTSVPVAVLIIQILSVVVTLVCIPLIFVALIRLIQWLGRTGR
jgi:hypothetical protein